MTISVNTQNEQEEKVLIAFLESLNYDYQTEDEEDVFLTDEQKAEILRRDNELREGKVTARDWSEIKAEMERVYR
jgi:putative addiction module component (TIGR02574 family)